jgi:hypothetical protein
MNIVKEYHGKKDNPFCYKITRGNKYLVNIIHKQLASDTWLEHRWVFIDDDGNSGEISHHFIDDCFYSVDKWREIQLNEIGIK